MKRRAGRVAVLAAAAGLVLAACGDSDIDGGSDAGSTENSDCEMNMAVNPWVGYEASAYVVGQIAETELGCTVEYKDLKEEVSWQGFASGDVDVIIENWGHPGLEKKYIEEEGVATDLGPNGNEGIIGWYVPPWLAEEHPEVLDWENLNDFASDFATAETAPKGQLLDGDPSYVTNDEALVKNLDLNFEVVVGGSEAALIQQFRSAEENQEWLLAYFYSPQWFWNEMQPVRVNLPPYEPGCDADAAKVACDYPEYTLNKIASTEWVDAGGPAVDLVTNFEWTNDDQDLVATAIADEGMTPEDAAQQWIDDNPDVWQQWTESS